MADLLLLLVLTMAMRVANQDTCSQNLDHLGLVAAMYDELGIGEILNQSIEQDTEQRHVTIGQAVKALVINGLGFINRALYLLPEFFENKPTERLIGEGIKPEHLNDDMLGRALDTLYEKGVTSLFTLISAKACKILGLRGTLGHLDSTSFHVDGKYEREGDEGTVEICRGYSRDHRPDLNQVIIDLIVENKAGIPLLMKPCSGNSTDTPSFGKVIEDYIDQLSTTHSIAYWVADSAVYSAKNLNLLSDHKGAWITRVPETLALAKKHRNEIAETKELSEGYYYRRVEIEYAGIKQRWLILTSVHRLEMVAKSVGRKIKTKGAKEFLCFNKLCRKRFVCEADARQEMAECISAFEVLQIVDSEVVSIQKEKGGIAVWEIQGYAASDPSMVWSLLWQGATFILGTNELDDRKLTDIEILQIYKDQQKVERGFRFFKDPRFQASTLFLKSPQRIMALLMVMTVCLLVYAALEYRLREALAQKGQCVPDQKGKPTKNPTMRWVFQVFTGIHVLLLDKAAKPIILNLKEQHRNILRALGPPYQKMYV